MEFKPVLPLTNWARRARAVLIVFLLLGNLFPAVAGVSLALVAAVLVAPVILYETLRWLPKLHKVFLFAVPLFGVVAMHALFIAPSPDYGQDKFGSWLTTTLLSALAAMLIRDRESIFALARTWVVVASVIGLVAVAGFEGGRADVFDQNPIWTGRALATAIVMLLWLLWAKAVRIPLFVVGFAVLTAGLLATGSRGPLLAVAAGAIVLAVFSSERRAFKVAGIAALAGFAYWAVGTWPFFENSRLRNLLQDGGDGSGREVFWQITPPLIEARPWGVGFGNWAAEVGAPSNARYPHNLFLEVFAEMGILIGLVVILAVLLVLFRLSRQASKQRTALLVFALLVGETIAVSVSGDLNARTFFFVLTLGYLFAAKNAIVEETPIGEGRPSTLNARSRV